jgi:hypothetical protein
MQKEIQDAYTHGFEEIYALEEVDVKTIRPMVDLQPKKMPIPPKKGLENVSAEQDLPFPDRFLTPVYPFPLFEWADFLFEKSNPLSLYCFLETYELHFLVTLSARQMMDYRRASQEKKEVLAQEAKKELIEIIDPKPHLFKLVQRYVIPWLSSRNGLATTQELMERLYQISDYPEITDQLFKILGDLFFDGGFPLAPFLVPLDRDLFGKDQEVKKNYNSCIKLARSYFYKTSCHYSVKELVVWMSNEMAQSWESFSESFMTQAIRSSSSFCAQKGDGGELRIFLCRQA